MRNSKIKELINWSSLRMSADHPKHENSYRSVKQHSSTLNSSSRETNNKTASN